MIENQYREYFPMKNVYEISEYCRSENLDVEYFLYKINEKKRNEMKRLPKLQG